MERADEQLRLPPATIETEDELVQVALGVLGADAVEGPAEPGLQASEDRVRPGQPVDRLAIVTALARAVDAPDLLRVLNDALLSPDFSLIVGQSDPLRHLVS